MTLKNLIPATVVFITLTFMTSCGTSENSGKPNAATEETDENDSYKPAASKARNIGVGPVKHVELGAIDAGRVQLGKEVFEAKCTSCHKTTEERFVGPGLKGVTLRREPEWIMNQILVPDKMMAEDSTAKALLEIYLTQMTNQDVTEEQARNILEYFRSIDQSK